MRYILTLIAVLFSASVYSALSFSVDMIADSLLKNSNVIIRYDSISYRIISAGKAEMKRYRVLTILNKHGEDFAENYVVFDRNSKVNSFSGEILDADGNRIRKIKKDDITDNSLVGSYNLYQDDRYLSFTALNPNYPYSIVAEYSVTFNGIVSIDRWFPVPDYNVAVEKAVYEISTSAINLKFKVLNFDNKLEGKSDNSGNFHKWIYKNVPAIEKEPYAPARNEVFPVIWSVPEVFEYEGKKGSFESWESFGKWEWNLINDKQALPESSITEIKRITENAKGDIEKVKILYQYLQSKTRYVSIQLGIGGWEPFPASVVDEIGYGDCKALSNYMVALLKAVNIESYYTLIGNGDQKIQFTDFPSMGQANHVIICVPIDNDSIWLECTNQRYPFGYIGKGNSGRFALLITSDGGKLVKTPESGKEQNRQIRKAEITLENSGNGKAIVKTIFSGLQFSNRHFLLSESSEDQKEWYLKNLSLSSPVVNAFKLTEQKFSEPVINEELDLFIPKSAVISGNRLFLKPNFLNAFASSPVKTEKRKFDVKSDFAFTDIDTVYFTIPDGYQPESVFKNVELKTEFGEYLSKVRVENKQVFYERRIVMNKGIWPASKYDEFRIFINSISKADQANLVFKKD